MWPLSLRSIARGRQQDVGGRKPRSEFDERPGQVKQHVPSPRYDGSLREPYCTRDAPEASGVGAADCTPVGKQKKGRTTGFINYT